MNKEIECETCIKRKTMYCPNSSECMSREDKPFYQNRIMLLKENEKLKDRDLIFAIELDKLQQENEKLNHYKLLYQKVKERNAKAIEFIEELYDNTDDITCYDIDRYRREELLDVLKGESYE